MLLRSVVLSLKKTLSKLWIVVFVLVSILTLSSCKKDPGVYDEITKKCTLNASYAGKDFINDGIGSATLSRATDGDTASFKLASGVNVTIRFHGIDTPESTGSIEKWGKAASMFVEERLTAATEIVLEATTTPASHDSYGVRYLGYVWYRKSDSEAFKNLNLEVVENGYSQNKCLQTSEFKYYNYFKEAADFAKDKSLHIYSNDEDPYFSDKAIEVTIKDLIENIDQYYNEEKNSGSKVRITGYVTELETSGSGSVTYTYKVSELIDGQVYSIKVYGGYSNKVTEFVKVGTKYKMTGSVQKHDNSYQISGLSYVPLQQHEDYVTVLQKDYYLTFNSMRDYTKYYGDSLYSDLTVTAAVIENNKLKLTATAKNAKKADSPVESFTIFAPAGEDVNVSSLVGKKLKTQGLQEKEKEITVLKYEDLKFN